MPRPPCPHPKKNNQPAVFLTFFNTTPRKNNQSVALVFWFHVFAVALAMFPPPSMPFSKKAINLWRYSMQHPKKGNRLAALVVWLGFSRRIGNVASSNAATPQKNDQPAPSTLHPIKNQFVALVGLVPCCIDATSLPKKINLRHCWPS